MRLIKKAILPVELGSAQSSATPAGHILGLRPCLAFEVDARGGEGAQSELADAGISMKSEEAPLEGDDET